MEQWIELTMNNDDYNYIYAHIYSILTLKDSVCSRSISTRDGNIGVLRNCCLGKVMEMDEKGMNE